jgi:hypothetical protein
VTALPNVDVLLFLRAGVGTSKIRRSVLVVITADLHTTKKAFFYMEIIEIIEIFDYTKCNYYN